MDLSHLRDEREEEEVRLVFDVREGREGEKVGMDGWMNEKNKSSPVLSSKSLDLSLEESASALEFPCERWNGEPG